MHLVTFCTLNKKFYKKEISHDSTIEEAKKLFCEDTSECNLQSIKMIYNKQVLQDNITISSLELKEKDFILVLINSKKSISKPEFTIPEIKPLPFDHMKSDQKLHINGPKRLTIVNKITKKLKILTILPSDMNKKKYKKLIQKAKRDSKKVRDSPETKVQAIQIMISAIQSHNITFQTSSHRHGSRKIRQNLNNKSQRLYFLPIDFRNKPLCIYHDRLLRRTSNYIHLLIILENIRFMQFVYSFLFYLILFNFSLVYHIFSY